MPKIFNTEISILLNTEKIPILKFNSTELFGIGPDIPKIPKCTTFSAKKTNNFVLPKISGIFSVFVWYFLVFLVLITKIPNFGMKIEYWKKKSNFFGFFYRKCSTFRYFRYYGNTEYISDTVQCYWILKMFNTEISIPLKIENVQYRNFNTIEYWKCSIPNFQYYWIPKKIPIPNFNNTKNYFQYFSPP